MSQRAQRTNGGGVVAASRSRDSTSDSTAELTPPPAGTVAPATDERVVGGFRLLGKLGAGGMGSVWRARQEAVRREVALKLLDPHLARDPVFVERFMRESRAAARVNHPNVVACY